MVDNTVMLYPRFIKKSMTSALMDTPVIMIIGARQTGKSTLMKELISQYESGEYITLDDVTNLTSARNDPYYFLSRLKTPAVIDEIQHAPELFLSIKMLVDENRKPGHFLLTGSANVLLLPEIADSLAGRMEVFTLFPLSVGEIIGQKTGLISTLYQSNSFDHLPKPQFSVEELIQKVFNGGYPEIQKRHNRDRQLAWFQSYINTLIQRDIRELANIEDLTRIPRLLSLLVTRSSSLLNFAELSRSTGLPASTLSRYFTLLQTLFLVHTLPAWSTNRGKRLIKSPKLFINDTGILCYLLGIEKEAIINNPHLWGDILETFVITELLKQSSWHLPQPRLYHYRTISGLEVDLVLEMPDGKLVGIEVKASQKVTLNDFKGLKSLHDDVGEILKYGIVLYTGERIVSFGERFYAIPLSMAL